MQLEPGPSVGVGKATEELGRNLKNPPEHPSSLIAHLCYPHHEASPSASLHL